MIILRARARTRGSYILGEENVRADFAEGMENSDARRRVRKISEPRVRKVVELGGPPTSAEVILGQIMYIMRA